MTISKKYLEREYCQNGLNTKEISKKCNVTQKKIWYLMVKYGIPRRGKSEIGTHELCNQRFGKLVVIRKASMEECPQKNKGTYWICKCDCGKTGIFKGNSMSNGYTKSCGCLWKHAAYERISGSYWWGIKNGADKRALEFKITQKDAWEMFVKQKQKCSLSNVDIVFGNGLTRKNQTASLDRIDSSKGYVNGNVRWIHKSINQMKMDMTDADFLKWVNTIASYQKSRN